uniref:Retrovirus-related Pol polyprotein from transposon TNT 1-94 n=1 Tax=Tanacetum cinerariifolium TaxID=118510 RepID=A0A699KCW4_TANCI|nr:retrovirus-related Pol polyprotein from transposon TNT 1-94 [Tanacetum cinerariifolium]
MVMEMEMEMVMVEMEMEEMVMIPEEEDRVEKFIRELTRLQDAVRIANNLMDKKLKDYVMKTQRTRGYLTPTTETTVGSNHHSNNIILEVTMLLEPIRLVTMRRGDPGEGMLTKSMAVNLIAGSASECLFDDFLTEIEPEKVSEALKHP